MVVLADTLTAGSEAGRSACINALSSLGLTNVDFELSDAPFECRTESWFPQPKVRFHRHVGSAHRMWRTAPELRRADEPERLSFGFKIGRSGVVDTPQATRRVAPGDVYLVDQKSAMDYVSDAAGGCFIFSVDLERIGLSVDTVRRAVPRVAESPVFPVFQHYLTSLDNGLEGMMGGAAGSMIGSATVDLARAVVLTAAGEGPRARESMWSTEFARAEAFIQQHLADPDLSAAKIARATHISTRQLYKLWEHQPLTLGEHIIRERLERTRVELVSSASPRMPIARIAARWGFINATHFSRRFHAAYGLSPREWRVASTATASDVHRG